MITGELFASISPYLISDERWNMMKYYEIATVTASNPWPWENMLLNTNKCENGWLNFSASFRVVALKLTELIWVALKINDFFQYLTCQCTVSDVIMSYRLLCVELASTSLSLYTLCYTDLASGRPSDRYRAYQHRPGAGALAVGLPGTAVRARQTIPASKDCWQTGQFATRTAK